MLQSAPACEITGEVGAGGDVGAVAEAQRVVVDRRELRDEALLAERVIGAALDERVLDRELRIALVDRGFAPEIPGRVLVGGDRWHREGMTGIEPALSAWEAEVLPLNYIPVQPFGAWQG